MRTCALLLLALIGTAPATAGTVVSDQVSDVSVTVYREPGRSGGRMDAQWPRGYAFISETRRIHIPAGESLVRFEGVADGMLPETAIVTGLPEGVREKNRDARLLTAAGLVDAYLKRSVHLRRTSRATGKVTEQDAVIQAGPQGGVVLQTAEGVEALGCSGLPERMLYDGVPEDLSAKPTLSVLTTSTQAVDVTVTLSYLAQGFDWSADYVAQMGEDGHTVRLFAWLTVANGGVQSFPDARLQVVAGEANKEDRDEDEDEEDYGADRDDDSRAGHGDGLALECWPMDTTSTHPRWDVSRLNFDLNKLPQYMPAEGIIVTAQRRVRQDFSSNSPIVAVDSQMIARQEDLGDLKLYRVPMRVTVAAQGQKQVAMIDQPEAKFERLYTNGADEDGDEPNEMMVRLRAKNIEKNGLGIPLPGGTLSLFEPVGEELFLLGRDHVADRAIGERIQFDVGTSPDVHWTRTKLRETKKRQYWSIEISNARPVPIQAQLSLPGKPADKPKGLVRDDQDGWVITAEVPANSRKTVAYQIKLD